MTAAAALAALPAGALVTWLTLRSTVARRLVSTPRGDRWRTDATPTVGGLGIFAGLLAGVGAAVAAGAIDGDLRLAGILAGCTIVFVSGLADDLWTLSPLTKIATQLAAAGVALAGGLSVEIVANDVVAVAIGLAWFVGMTNAFNLLDNMDALAAALAFVAALSFAIDAAVVSTGGAPVALALALAAACAAFLPFNLAWRRRRPLAFMGDSGSQTIGFALAALGLASSWSVAGATLATVLVPLFVLGVPIIDTGLVAIGRLREGRPIHQGGRDHTSHRLVYRGLTEGRAVALLVGVAAALAATSLAYRALDQTALTLVGLFVTFAALVQFVSYLSAVDTGSAAAATTGRRTPVDLRRLVEVLVDFALVSAAFIAAYTLVVGAGETEFERHVFSLALPAVVASRFVGFLVFGIYKRVWRYAGARDAAAIGLAVALSEIGALAPALALDELAPFPMRVFVVDAVLCTLLVGLSRFGERALDEALTSLRDRRSRRRVLIVGAGSSGRSLLRELRESPDDYVIGFLDDNPALRGRRLQGVGVRAGLDGIGRVLEGSRPDVVLITIPSAPAERLEVVVAACAVAGIPCRVVQRRVDVDPLAVLGAAAK
jgi:UDP-GlcNAc:undecaprenyl-phosphate GlcNAc-1-phosphate transferase